MCEVGRRDGAKCPKPSDFLVSVRVYPQPLGEGGKWGTEGPDAGRNILACAHHVARAILDLNALPIRRYGALPTVAPQARSRTALRGAA